MLCDSKNFYPRPPRGGRRRGQQAQGVTTIFLSTPSARRATRFFLHIARQVNISIHALREEGDQDVCSASGGTAISIHALREEGDPEPPDSGRASTISIHALREEGDSPSGRSSGPHPISIHALREEGDDALLGTVAALNNFYPRPPRGGRLVPPRASFSNSFYFYPRPPRGGRQQASTTHLKARRISIHALREEGDGAAHSALIHDFVISIHALREEGDLSRTLLQTSTSYFYPRPPRGGRPSPRSNHGKQNMISIHALREEGDIRRHDGGKLSMEFLSTPSARRATRVLAVGVSLFH